MMNEIITQHALRTIILQFDESKAVPGFETQALQTYYEMHDRIWQWAERLRTAREKIPPLDFQLERVEEVYEEARQKLEHLLVMIPENPERPRVTMQLKIFTQDLNRLLCGFVPDLVDHLTGFYEYDTYTIEKDAWLIDTAFKQFNAIFGAYEQCAVDMVSFDRDLDDFKSILGHIRKREGKYYDAMNEIIDNYTDLNERIDKLYDRINEFDDTLLDFVHDAKGNIGE